MWKACLSVSRLTLGGSNELQAASANGAKSSKYYILIPLVGWQVKVFLVVPDEIGIKLNSVNNLPLINGLLP